MGICSHVLRSTFTFYHTIRFGCNCFNIILASHLNHLEYSVWLRIKARGGNFHYKGIYRCAAGMGYTFQASQYMNGYHFYIKSISMGYLFHPKSI